VGYYFRGLIALMYQCEHWWKIIGLVAVPK
jgi:hypothetical protein